MFWQSAPYSWRYWDGPRTFIISKGAGDELIRYTIPPQNNHGSSW